MVISVTAIAYHFLYKNLRSRSPVMAMFISLCENTVTDFVAYTPQHYYFRHSTVEWWSMILNIEVLILIKNLPQIYLQVRSVTVTNI